MYVVDPEYVKGKYNLPALRELENLVADAVQISVPFNNPITGFCAFTHKAGIHAKAILANPSTYEMCVLLPFVQDWTDLCPASSRRTLA